ncbi:acyl-CoA dehydrogenase C-terminal domain-containing protein [Shewanella sedimentimangrovi]|uniref:Acyl-CoA dehydrogenase C-terminal domain-containing protein n=1 Tax=Shewanella sedimentimangrovi TaxID=2814293 RepID=A0ABX7R853_9GAMM|nr:acyl-CoA dehydrogenase C-terminal domain-containing protein [Shewanella sedimentimangrovi]QSX38933.1 acyl-CoA dehydrogenase C-terminal domain-containing protein [Shewanella sedimentimangrovi]
MYPYSAPLNEMRFLLDKVFKAPAIWQRLPQLAETVDLDTAMAILEEAAKLNRDIVQPINRAGDEQGVRFEDGTVITPDGYKEAYQAFMEGGWVGFCGDPEFGGMGMPKMLGVLVDEMGYSVCNAFNLYSSLTAGAALALNAHGSDELKDLYLPKLYSGEWAGAMDMTEPQAGSDLRGVRTRAEPRDDGSFLISGSKIFITGGDQDLTSNVVHLVLAKLVGSQSLSLFLVPKLKVNDDGSLGENNGVSVGSIEHKMGLKGSATCVMNFDNARGFLIGEADRGLACMFTMMNYERLAIGIQGLGSAQAASQMATDYAKERLQGLAATGSTAAADPILVHGDVRRMLLTIRSLTEAGRALAVDAGMQLDLAKFSEDEAERAKAARFVGLLTPVAKAFLTDRGLDACIMAQQVFGGAGYIRETGIEQFVRDTRIAQIYEGTNGIQAIDFLGRKVTGDNLATLNEFIAELKTELAALAPEWQDKAGELLALLDELIASAGKINDAKREQPALINSVAVDYLDAFGFSLYGYYWIKMAALAQEEADESFAQQKAAFCRFYLEKLLPRARWHLSQVNAGAGCIMEPGTELF